MTAKTQQKIDIKLSVLMKKKLNGKILSSLGSEINWKISLLYEILLCLLLKQKTESLWSNQFFLVTKQP